MPKHRLRLKPGPKPKPKSDAEAELQALDTANSPQRRHISSKQRLFVSIYADQNFRDPYLAAQTAGFERPSVADKLVVKLADLIEAERLRRAMGRQMEIDEALEGVALIARAEPDSKVRHAALRTVLEVHGVLTGQPRVDRRETMRTIHSLVAAIKSKLADGARIKLRAGTRETRQDPATGRLDTSSETVVEAEISDQAEIPPPVASLT